MPCQQQNSSFLWMMHRISSNITRKTLQNQRLSAAAELQLPQHSRLCKKLLWRAFRTATNTHQRLFTYAQVISKQCTKTRALQKHKRARNKKTEPSRKHLECLKNGEGERNIETILTALGESDHRAAKHWIRVAAWKEKNDSTNRKNTPQQKAS